MSDQSANNINVLMTLDEVRARLGRNGEPLPRATFARWRTTREFPAPSYVGRTPIWPARSVEHWCATHSDAQARRPIPASQRARLRLIDGAPGWLD